MSKYIQVTHSDGGKMICRFDQLKNTLDGEFDGFERVGDSITFTVVEMADEDYEKLPEFTGW